MTIMTEPRNIDWENIRTIDDVMALPKHLIFDEADVQPIKLKLREGLTEQEKIEAEWWKQFAYGLMYVTGDYGGGKGIWMHLVMFYMKYYFVKSIVTDTRPKPAFGECVPFAVDMMIEQAMRMEEVSTGIPRERRYKGLYKYDFEDIEEWKVYRDSSPEDQFKELQKRGDIKEKVIYKSYVKGRNEFITIPDFKPYVDTETGKWISSRGEVFLQNCVIGLDEYIKYVPRLASTTSISQAIISMQNFLRHQQALVLAVGASLDDYNKRTFKQASWEASCKKLDNNMYRYSDNPADLMFEVKIWKVKYNELQDRLMRTEKIAVFKINASEPKSILGGVGWKDIYVTENSQALHIPISLRRA